MLILRAHARSSQARADATAWAATDGDGRTALDVLAARVAPLLMSPATWDVCSVTAAPAPAPGQAVKAEDDWVYLARPKAEQAGPCSPIAPSDPARHAFHKI